MVYVSALLVERGGGGRNVQEWIMPREKGDVEMREKGRRRGGDISE